MEWVRLPTRLTGQPEILELVVNHKDAGAAAAYFHIGAMTWSAAQETAGDIPVTLLRMIGAKPRHARILEETGLWSPIPNGWFLVDFWEWTQPERRAHIPVALRRTVYERDGFTCLACGTTARLSLDHVVPWSQGGQDTLENLRTLCVHCNSARSDRSDELWGGI